jgi:hypothetical protein
MQERTRRVRLNGRFTPGQRLHRSRRERIDAPVDFVHDDRELYRVMERGIPALNIRPNDILVIEPRPRGNAAATELVLAEHEGRACVGRWWTEGGRRAVLDEARVPIVEGAGIRIVGAIALVARLGLWR